MNTLWNYYFNFSIKFRLSALCVCYSLCILAAGYTVQFGSPLIRYGSTGLFIVLGAVFGWANIWSINRPIQRTIAYLQTMAGGDLTENISILRKNEFSRMLVTLKELQNSMRTMITGMQGTAAHLTSASDLLSTTSFTSPRWPRLRKNNQLPVTA